MNTVLITGASTGVGYAAACAFANAGFQVIATMRNLDKASALKQSTVSAAQPVDIRVLDVTDDASVQTIVDSIIRDYRKIDVLLNNAGVGFLGALEQTSLAQAQAIMDINFFGVWRVTQAVLPYMRDKKSGRILSITSMAGFHGQPFNDAYCAAKFAVEGFMESLAPVVQNFGIQVSIIEPGPIASNFIASAKDKSPVLSKELQLDYQGMLDLYLNGTMKVVAESAQKPAEIAAILLEIATTKQVDFRYQTSDIGRKMAAIKFSDATGNQCIALSGQRLQMNIKKAIIQLTSRRPIRCGIGAERSVPATTILPVQ